jgi:hypothetical protein
MQCVCVCVCVCVSMSRRRFERVCELSAARESRTELLPCDSRCVLIMYSYAQAPARAYRIQSFGQFLPQLSDCIIAVSLRLPFSGRTQSV